MASKIIDVNPRMAGLIGKALGLSRVVSIDLSAHYRKKFTTIKVEFVPDDEQCNRILGAFDEVKP